MHWHDKENGKEGSIVRTALVTGATYGAGQAIAVALAKAGWRTHALGHDRSVLDEMRAGYGILPLAMDLTDRDDLRVIAGYMQLDAVVLAPIRWSQEGRFVDLGEATSIRHWRSISRRRCT